MPVLAFQIQADYDKVIRLREEIQKLKAEMKDIDAVNSPHQFNVLNQKLKQCTVEYSHIAEAAVQAGAKIETGFKKKIYDAQQTVNDFTEKIIAQRSVVKGIESDVNRLGEAYRKATKSWDTTKANSLLKDYNQAKTVLNEERGALFELTQERSKAQLGVKKLREEYQLFAKESGASSSILTKMKKEIMGLGAGMLAGFGLKELGAEIIRVRGQFQQADTAIQTLLGSKEKADAFLSKVRDYAKISPLEFGDITKASQMMLGFNIEAEKVPGFIKAIGDVSMGEAGRFNSLTLAFSQMSATGKLMGQDLLQMINAGFNPLTVMAEKTGKSVAQLKEEMSKGAISAEMVQQAFIDATSAGGKFYNMSENAAKTINGQLSMMHDALDASMNDVGKASETVIVGAISGVTKLIENYETVGRVLLGLVTTYGTYRTALALVTFAENGHTLAMTLARAQILLTQKAQALLNATMLANPYVLAAATLGGLLGVLIATSDTLSAAEHAQKNFNETLEENNRKVQEDKKEIDKLLATLADENEAQGKRTEAYQKLITNYPEIFSKYKTEKELIDNLTEARQRENAEIEKKAKLLSKQTYENSKQRANDLRRLSQLYGKDHLSNKEMKEKDDLQRNYNDYIRENGGNGLVMSKMVNKAADTAQKEYNLNVNENRQKQIAERNKRYKEMKKEAADAEKKRINALIKRANEAGKKYIKLGGDDEPVSLDQAKSFVQTLQTNIDTTRKTMRDWRKDAEEEAKKNKKTQKDLEESTELLTNEEATKKVSDANAYNQNLNAKAESYKIKDKAGDTDAKKKKEEAKKKLEAEEKIRLLSDKQAMAQKRAAEDLEFSTREAEINAMREGTAKKLAQIELDHDKELEAIERAYSDLKQKRIDEAKQLWDADPNNNGKNFFDSDEFKKASSDDRYTKEERANKVAKRKAADVDYTRSINDVKNEELQVLYDYLKEFGSIEEKKLAITKEYEQKIAEEQDPTKRAVLRLKQDEKLEAVSQEHVAQQVDWSGIFSNLSGHTQTYLEGLREQLQGLISQGGMSLEDMAVAQEKIRDINALISEQGTFFTSLSPLQIEYNRRLQEEADAKARLQVAQNEQSGLEATVSMNKASMQQYLKDNGIKDTGEISKEMANPFKANTKEYEAFNKMLEDLKVNEGKLAKARDKTNKATQEAKKAEDGTKQTTKQKWEKFQENKTFQGVMTNVSEAPGLLSNLGLGKESEKAQKGLNGLNDAMGAATDFMTGNYIGALTKGVSAVMNFGEAFGVWSTSNRAEIEAANKKLADATATNTEAINRLTDAMEKQNPEEAYKSYKQALELTKMNEKAARDTILNNARMYDGGHSLQYDFNDDYGNLQFLRRIGNYLGKRITTLQELLELDAATLNKLYDDEKGVKLLQELGQRLYDTQDSGNYNGMMNDLLKYMSDYSKDAYDELAKHFQESVTHIGFDTMYDNFVSNLMDMNKEAEDFAHDFEGYLRTAIYQAMLSKNGGVKDMLSKWYDHFAEAMETPEVSGSYLSESEIKDLMDEYQKIKDAADKVRDSIEELGLYDGTGSGKTDKSATYASAEKATYDQFDTFIGIATAQQIALEHIKDMISGITGDGLYLTNMNLEQMLSIVASQYEITSDSRDLLAKSYLELQEANEHLGKIEKSVETINNNVSETRRIINDRL